MDATLVIGNRNYSSWSLRGWLALRKAGADFEVIRLPLDTPEFHARIGEYSPSRLVPVLRHAGRVIWDSLAIGEYANEVFANGTLWPGDVGARALARSVSAQMHAGFPALREEMPMNARAVGRRVPETPALARDIERVAAIWSECRARHGGGGPWLFGAFSIADAMFAPVALRFRTYGVSPGGAAGEYLQTPLTDPDVSEWTAEAAGESEVLEREERGA